MPGAVLEWAWDALAETAEEGAPDGSELAEWLSDVQADELTRMAHRLVRAHPDPGIAAAWLQWVQQSLHPPDRRGAAAVGVQPRRINLPPRKTEVVT